MKMLLLLAAVLISWSFTDLESEETMLCIIAPMFLSIFVVLGIAKFIQEYGVDFGSSDDTDGGGFDD